MPQSNRWAFLHQLLQILMHTVNPYLVHNILRIWRNYFGNTIALLFPGLVQQRRSCASSTDWKQASKENKECNIFHIRNSNRRDSPEYVDNTLSMGSSEGFRMYFQEPVLIEILKNVYKFRYIFLHVQFLCLCLCSTLHELYTLR